LLTLSTKHRFNTMRPSWAGNDAAPAPFEVKVARRSKADLEEWDRRTQEFRQKSHDARELAAHLEGFLSGPFTFEGRMSVDGVVVVDGDLEGLLSAARADRESLYLRDNLWPELVALVFTANVLNERAAGESERRLGGAGTTGSPTATTAAPPAPEVAASAAASSSPSSPEALSSTG
jgi:hypothetical protein